MTYGHGFTTLRRLFPQFRCDLNWHATAIVLGVALLISFGGRQDALADGQPIVASEYDLKLAHIYKTAKFISWPDDAAGSAKPFMIGVIDPEPFQGGLERLAAKRKLKDRQIRVVIIKSEKDYQACHILFIPNEAKPELVEAILKRSLNQPVLVWRDQAESFQLAGASCAFIREGDKVIIEADPAELKRRNLLPDGQLMNLNMVRAVKPRK